MALLYRNELGVICLKTDKSLADDPIELSLLSHDKKILALSAVKRTANLFELQSPFFSIENACLAAGGQIYLQGLSRASGVNDLEPVSFEPSFFAPHIDFSRSEALPPFNYSAYKRPEKLAVFTHVSNEDFFLKIFIDYYSKMTDRAHIYIVDHGSVYKSRWLQAETGCQVIRIPKGEVDHLNMKRYVEYFQRFLLTQYEWVLQADCDELLVHKEGPAYFRNALLDQYNGCVLQPRVGLNLVQNPKTEGEINADAPITSQRNHYVVAAHYNKPALSSIPTTWGLGFHKNLSEQENVVLDDLYLIHLAYVSLEESARRNRHWKNYALTEGDAQTVYRAHRSESRETVTAHFLELLSPGSVAAPSWLLGQF